MQQHDMMIRIKKIPPPAADGIKMIKGIPSDFLFLSMYKETCQLRILFMWPFDKIYDN